MMKKFIQHPMSYAMQSLIVFLSIILVISSVPNSHMNAESIELNSIEYKSLSFHDIWNLNTSEYVQMNSYAFILNSKIVINYTDYKLFGIRFTAFLEHMNDTVNITGNYGFGLLFRSPIHEFQKISPMKEFVIPCIIENFSFKNPIYQEISIRGVVQDVDTDVTNGFIPIIKTDQSLMNIDYGEKVTPQSFSDWCTHNRSSVEKVNFQGKGSIIGIRYSEISSILEIIESLDMDRIAESLIDIIVDLDSDFEILKVLRDLPFFDVGCYLFIEEGINSTRHIIPFIYVSFLEYPPSFLQTMKKSGKCSLYNVSGWYLNLELPNKIDEALEFCVNRLDSTSIKNDFISGFLFGIQMEENVSLNVGGSGSSWLPDNQSGSSVNWEKLWSEYSIPCVGVLFCIGLLRIFRKKRR